MLLLYCDKHSVLLVSVKDQFICFVDRGSRPNLNERID